MHAGPVNCGRVEIGGAARRPGRFASRVSDDEFTASIRGGRSDEPFLLVFRSVVPDRHEAEPVHQHRGAESGIDRLYLLGGEHEIDIRKPAAAVFRGQHGEGDSLPARLRVSLLGELESLQWVRFRVDLVGQRGEVILREGACGQLNFSLFLGEGEVDGHDAAQLVFA